MNALEKIASNPWITIIGFVVGILGLVWAFYEYFKNKKFKELSYYRTNYNVVENGKNSISKMSILYDGKEVNNVTITKFAIWNSGKETIREDDLVSPQMIQIKTGNGAKLLDIQLVSETNKNNKFSIISSSEDSVILTFDYTKMRDGCVLQLLHTGKISDVSIFCELKEGNNLKAFDKYRIPSLLVELGVSGLFELGGVTSMVAVILYYKKLERLYGMDWNVRATGLASQMTVVTVSGLLLGIILLCLSALPYRNLYRKKIPRKLRPYVKVSSKYYNEDED